MQLQVLNLFLWICCIFFETTVASPINNTLSTTTPLPLPLNHTHSTPIKRQDLSTIFLGDYCTHPTFGTTVRQNDPNWCLIVSQTDYPYRAGNQNRYDEQTFYLFRNTCELIGYATGIYQGDGERYAFDSELPQVLVVETSQTSAGVHPHIFYGAGGNNLPECWHPDNGVSPPQYVCKLWFQCHCDGENGFC
ncbi:uncharacterized protein PAC_16383 [Phialocephala subalpina]|uniref:Uncharacterized protein n=1 Tax=Phialocephala subalpina TaxID=576137 RepID=A0A1L7XN73_9HELO|nr:uncharacterized protein PAC_16383 [Phialocephala subalpina]